MTKDKETSTWDCTACVEQMMGGPRCFHNPTPEQREARGLKYVVAARRPTPPKPVRKRRKD